MIEQGYHLTQVAVGLSRSFLHICCDGREDITFRISGSVALFSDGKACHLQGRICKDFLQTGVFRLVGAIQNQRLHNTANYSFVHGIVSL